MENNEAESLGKLSKSARQKKILSELISHPAIRVSELAQKFNVTTETIRRDLDELSSMGLISRTYGGAARSLSQEPAILERNRLYSNEREHIALKMCEFINNGDVLILGSGSTTYKFSQFLANTRQNLTVFTDSIPIASALANVTTNKVHLAPGLYSDDEKSVYGPETVEYFHHVYANQVILGASGLTPEGISNADYDIGESYRTMIDRSTNVSVIADHSKFNQRAVNLFGYWKNITRLVTDQPVDDKDLLNAILSAGTEIIVAD